MLVRQPIRIQRGERRKFKRGRGCRRGCTGEAQRHRLGLISTGARLRAGSRGGFKTGTANLSRDFPAHGDHLLVTSVAPASEFLDETSCITNTMVSFLRFGASLIHRDWWRRRTLEISPSTAVDLEYGLPLAVRDARRRRMDFQPAGDDENVLILI